jgi:hypothetical protein
MGSLSYKEIQQKAKENLALGEKLMEIHELTLGFLNIIITP